MVCVGPWPTCVISFECLKRNYVVAQREIEVRWPLICIQGPAKKRFPGCENFVLAVAYHFCLALPEKFSQPGNHSFAGPCTTAASRPKGQRPTSNER